MSATDGIALQREEGIRFFRDMLRIRRFEEKSAELYGAGKIRGFLHLYIGEEAIAAGVMPELRAEDSVVATYREHGHALLRGVSAESIMAEMYGKIGGCSRGRGGSMHLFDAKTRFYGGNAIVGGGIPLAVGLALAEKMKKGPGVSTCFFGDGAVAEGAFHESVNLAALWKLPVLLICENNLYAMGTALSRHQSQTNLSVKAKSYNLSVAQVDGMDVVAVNRATRLGLESIRTTGAPYFIEFLTYRFRAHSMYDADLYRPKEEVARWKKRDPIKTLEEILRHENWLDDQQLNAIEKEIEGEINRAVEFAEYSEWEPVEQLTRDVYARSPG